MIFFATVGGRQCMAGEREVWEHVPSGTLARLGPECTPGGHRFLGARRLTDGSLAGAAAGTQFFREWVRVNDSGGL